MSPTEADRPAGRHLDEIAAELYALRPEEFVAARDEQVKVTRAAGDAALARDVGRLRRPTQSAWLVNALWRDRQDEIEELLDLADEFRRALTQGQREALQELTARRRSLETGLLKRARVLADDAGVAANADTLREVQETLASALSETEVAEQVRTGRLVKPVTASGGFGAGAPDLRLLPGGKSAGTAKKAPTPRRTPGKAADSGASTADERRLAEAEQRVQDAEETVALTADELVQRTRVAEDAAGRHAELRELVARMEEQLRDLEKQLSVARSAAADEARRRDLADRAHRKAQDALDKAKQRLAALT